MTDSTKQGESPDSFYSSMVGEVYDQLRTNILAREKEVRAIEHQLLFAPGDPHYKEFVPRDFHCGDVLIDVKYGFPPTRQAFAVWRTEAPPTGPGAEDVLKERLKIYTSAMELFERCMRPMSMVVPSAKEMVTFKRQPAAEREPSYLRAWILRNAIREPVKRLIRK